MASMASMGWDGMGWATSKQAQAVQHWWHGSFSGRGSSSLLVIIIRNSPGRPVGDAAAAACNARQQLPLPTLLRHSRSGVCRCDDFKAREGRRDRKRGKGSSEYSECSGFGGDANGASGPTVRPTHSSRARRPMRASWHVYLLQMQHANIQCTCIGERGEKRGERRGGRGEKGEGAEEGQSGCQAACACARVCA